MSININVEVCKRKENVRDIIIDILFILICIIMSIIYIQNNDYMSASGWIFLFAVLLYVVVDK
jgi:hypothetical protein